MIPYVVQHVDEQENIQSCDHHVGKLIRDHQVAKVDTDLQAIKLNHLRDTLGLSDAAASRQTSQSEGVKSVEHSQE